VVIIILVLVWWWWRQRTTMARSSTTSSYFLGASDRFRTVCIIDAWLMTSPLGTPRGRYDEYSSKIFPQ
jgi:hypothetical protein